MKRSIPKLKKTSYISEENLQSLKIKQKILLKVVAYDVFSIFATVNHREFPVKQMLCKKTVTNF